MKIIMEQKELNKLAELAKIFDVDKKQIYEHVSKTEDDMFVIEVKHFDLILDIYKDVVELGLTTVKNFIAGLKFIKFKADKLDEIFAFEANKKEKEEKENDEVKDAE